MRIITALFTFIFLLITASMSAQQLEKDSFVTKKGQLDITFIKHGSLLFTYNGNTIYVDPVSDYADYSKLPKADVILITHEHADHFDPKAITDLKKESTVLVLNPAAQRQLGEGMAMKNGDAQQLTPYLYVEAVPAYNHEVEPEVKGSDKNDVSLLIIDETNLIFLEEEKNDKRKKKNEKEVAQPEPVKPKQAAPKREVYHPRNRDNGYVLTIDDKRIYVAGDTEDIIEMMELKDIDIAFLPVNQPYTMTPKQAANAALMFNPTILYPYHYGATRIEELQDRLYYDKHIEVRIRQLQ